jgi:Skp family chaperone for outer membrane proteins
VIAAGGILALGVLLYAGRVGAQQQSGAAGSTAPVAAPAPRTRVALLNLSYVIKNYAKFKTFQEEMKQAFEPYQKKDTAKKQALEALTKEAQQPGVTDAKREELTQKAKGIQREIEDNGAEAKAWLGRKTDEQMKILYLDIMDASQRYARAHDFELVLHYNDATTREDFLSPQNIARKLQAGALMPLYAVQGLDISKEVVDNLNSYLQAGPAPAAGGAGPGSQ